MPCLYEVLRTWTLSFVLTNHDNESYAYSVPQKVPLYHTDIEELSQISKRLEETQDKKSGVPGSELPRSFLSTLLDQKGKNVMGLKLLIGQPQRPPPSFLINHARLSVTVSDQFLSSSCTLGGITGQLTERLARKGHRPDIPSCSMALHSRRVHPSEAGPQSTWGSLHTTPHPQSSQRRCCAHVRSCLPFARPPGRPIPRLLTGEARDSWESLIYIHERKGLAKLRRFIYIVFHPPPASLSSRSQPGSQLTLDSDSSLALPLAFIFFVASLDRNIHCSPEQSLIPPID